MVVERLKEAWIVTLAIGCLSSGRGICRADEFRVSPTAIVLDCPEATQQVLVSQLLTDTPHAKPSHDVTRQVLMEIVPTGIAEINALGMVRPLADGKAELRVATAGGQLAIPIEVRAYQNPPPVSFRHEILPLLTKSRCNSGGCHGKAEGQNGLKLSVFGFDPLADYQALVLESRGRRISPANPSKSLVYQKGLAMMPHGGGMKIEPGSYRDHRLLRWIKEGASFVSAMDEQNRTVAIEIEPAMQVLTAGQTQQLRVTAVNASGQRHCVTAISEFESNAAAIADVDPSGLIQASGLPGEAAVLIRYAGHLAVCRVTMPRPQTDRSEPIAVRPPPHNFIDRFVWDKWERLGIRASEQCDDASFLRRVFLDTIGTLPTAAEASSFLDDTSEGKRDRLIDNLLNRQEYSDFWTMKWLNLLRADHLTVSPQGVVAMQRWLHQGFTNNQPYDSFARDLLTVQGNTSAVGPGSFYKILNKPDEAARSISQLLLGVRIECAQCHHHPSERWGQEDYVGLAGFFTGVSLKKLPNGEQAIVSRGGKDLPSPRGGDLIAARALGAPAATFLPAADRRQVLADWMTSPDNPYFAKTIANRLWAHYLGRGLIEPIDDIRETNPPSNEPLMAALENHLIDLKFDLKQFTRTLLQSRTYQLSSETNESNFDDDQSFSHAMYKSLPAEVLLDAICQVTGTPEKFNGWPDGYRAIQVWDNRLPSYFFTIFGRPVRASVCECERSNQPSISQALHLLNAPEIADKLEHRRGFARQLSQSASSPHEMINTLYLSSLSRLPRPEESDLMLQAFEPAGEAQSVNQRQEAAVDILWAILNSKEFLFNH